MKTKKNPKKENKSFFCPKCKNKDVKKIYSLKNIFGLYPKMRCEKCKHEEIIFPMTKQKNHQNQKKINIKH